jgi:hypothetical protein
MLYKIIFKSGTIKFDENGNRAINSRKVKLNVNREGALNINFGKGNIKNKKLLDESKAIKTAQKLISDLYFDKDLELKLGHIRHRFTSGGTMKGSGRIEEPAAVETIVQFRQCHAGVESVNSDHGLIAVSIDNDGSIINVYNSTRAVLGEADMPKSIIASPPEKTKSVVTDTETQFKKAVQGIVSRRSNSSAKASQKTKVIHEKVGYDLSGNLGLVVRQRDLDVDTGKDLRKRYKIRIRVMG